jgi:hypothetical protein
VYESDIKNSVKSLIPLFVFDENDLQNPVKSLPILGIKLSSKSCKISSHATRAMIKMVDGLDTNKGLDEYPNSYGHASLSITVVWYVKISLGNQSIYIHWLISPDV